MKTKKNVLAIFYQGILRGNPYLWLNKNAFSGKEDKKV
jgi:hypothetical protein